MITDLSPLLHHVTPAVRSEELQAKKGTWFHFSDGFSKDSKTGWASGNYFIVSADPLLVDYPVSNNIDEGDYVNLDLTNQTNPTIPGVPHPTTAQKGTLQMYPVSMLVVYQISVGMKKGGYFVQTYIPFGQSPIYALGSSAIPPSITDPVYRYLGAKYPKDSPVESPTWFIYTILSAPQIVLQPFMDTGDTVDPATGTRYGKATIVFRVNKCQLQQITLASVAAVATPVSSKQVFAVPPGNVAIVYGGLNGDTQVTSPQGSAMAVPNGQVIQAPANWTVNTMSGTALITTQDDIRKWRNIQEKSLYIPWWKELTGF